MGLFWNPAIAFLCTASSFRHKNDPNPLRGWVAVFSITVTCRSFRYAPNPFPTLPASTPKFNRGKKIPPPLSVPHTQSPRRAIADAESNVPARNPEVAMAPSVKTRVGQKTAFLLSSTVRRSACLISAFLVHSISFSSVDFFT